MKEIRILDCTLRDGGYVNNWDFNLQKSQQILQLLDKSSVDYIEIGFLQDCQYDKNKTLFNSFEDIKNLINDVINSQKLIGMITFGKFPIEKIPNINNSPIKQLRIIFKKEQKNEALKYCEEIQAKGYDVFINPTFTDQYNDEEIVEITQQINKIAPKGMTIVDSMGVLQKKDIEHLFYLIDKNLNKNIALGFHSHNNLQLSFPNAQALIDICENRELIIDSSLFGMGRGAGNLSTEVLIQYLNDNDNSNYDIIPISQAIEEFIKPIFDEKPWGYCIHYYLAAINHCHPNYAKFLADKDITKAEQINDFLKRIPNEKKSNFDEKIIQEICMTNSKVLF